MSLYDIVVGSPCVNKISRRFAAFGLLVLVNKVTSMFAPSQSFFCCSRHAISIYDHKNVSVLSSTTTSSMPDSRSSNLLAVLHHESRPPSLPSFLRRQLRQRHLRPHPSRNLPHHIKILLPSSSTDMGRRALWWRGGQDLPRHQR